jgi:NTE family protein
MADAQPGSRRRARTPDRLPLPDQVALVLQGGGALGAYQAGVVEGLEQRGIEIDWVAGISIGAVNAAILAGNPPPERVAKLRGFWEEVTGALPAFPFGGGDEWREWMHMMSAGLVAWQGVPGFFTPRALTPALAPSKTPGALSFYDSAPLAATLDAFVDWDLVNSGPVRLSVGAVDVETGNFRYFDSRKDRLDARHIMASGALPPGLPPVEIDGAWWWDGGLVSNTPLSYVLDNQAEDLLVFQVDLFAARGERPATIMDVYSREKDIRYSSRTRQVTDQLLRLRKEREAIRALLAKLPPALADDPDARSLATLAAEHAVNVVHLIYRKHGWEGGARDFEFSRSSMEHHWAEGAAAIAATMRHDALLARNIVDGKTAAFDLAP